MSLGDPEKEHTQETCQEGPVGVEWIMFDLLK